MHEVLDFIAFQLNLPVFASRDATEKFVSLLSIVTARAQQTCTSFSVVLHYLLNVCLFVLFVANMLAVSF